MLGPLLVFIIQTVANKHEDLPEFAEVVEQSQRAWLQRTLLVQ